MSRVRRLLGHFVVEKAAKKPQGRPSEEKWEDMLPPPPGAAPEVDDATAKAAEANGIHPNAFAMLPYEVRQKLVQDYRSSERGMPSRRANLGETDEANVNSLEAAAETQGTPISRGRRLLGHFGTTVWWVVVASVGVAFLFQIVRVPTGTTGEPRAGDRSAPDQRERAARGAAELSLMTDTSRAAPEIERRLREQVQSNGTIVFLKANAGGRFLSLQAMPPTVTWIAECGLIGLWVSFGSVGENGSGTEVRLSDASFDEAACRVLLPIATAKVGQVISGN